MRNLAIAIVLPLASAVLVVSCTAAQKNAVLSLGLDSTACVLQHLNMPFESALMTCGLDTLTDPAKREQLRTLFTSAQAGARSAGASIPDAGAP
jgi:hypothetical protein